jgi:hypothetical protein
MAVVTADVRSILMDTLTNARESWKSASESRQTLHPARALRIWMIFDTSLAREKSIASSAPGVALTLVKI